MYQAKHISIKRLLADGKFCGRFYASNAFHKLKIWKSLYPCSICLIRIRKKHSVRDKSHGIRRQLWRRIVFFMPSSNIKALHRRFIYNCICILAECSILLSVYVFCTPMFYCCLIKKFGLYFILKNIVLVFGMSFIVCFQGNIFIPFCVWVKV